MYFLEKCDSAWSHNTACNESASKTGSEVYMCVYFSKFLTYIFYVMHVCF